MTLTTATYEQLQIAYDHFNHALFDDKLPQCLITLSFQRSAYGYFRHKAFSPRADAPVRRRSAPAAITDEIALNPFTFIGRTDKEILGTLVHEMVHLWQHHFGTVGKTHHNKEWANTMQSLGLAPSSTGAPGGKRTGRRVSHYIIEDGQFDRAASQLKFKLDIAGSLATRPKKPSRRTKYSCPSCNINAYGKPDLQLICGACDEELEAA